VAYNTILGNKLNSTEGRPTDDTYDEVVLRSSDQVVPLVKFHCSSVRLGKLPALKSLHELHINLQLCNDRFLNMGYNVRVLPMVTHKDIANRRKRRNQDLVLARERRTARQRRYEQRKTRATGSNELTVKPSPSSGFPRASSTEVTPNVVRGETRRKQARSRLAAGLAGKSVSAPLLDRKPPQTQPTRLVLWGRPFYEMTDKKSPFSSCAVE